MARHYCSPGGFEIDARTGDEEITKDNVNEKSKQLVDLLRSYQSENYDHQFIMQ